MSLTDPEVRLANDLPLYALAESNPRPGEPGYSTIACTTVDGATGELLCLSPIDALIQQLCFNEGGRKYETLPYEAIDPCEFIENHDGRLCLHILYGYAAHNNKLLQDEYGHPEGLICIERHQFDPEDIEDHYHLKISKKTTGWLAKLYQAAGLPDFLNLVYEQAHCPMSDLDVQVSTALKVADYLNDPDQEPTQCAIYEPVESQWRLVDGDDIYSDD